MLNLVLQLKPSKQYFIVLTIALIATSILVGFLPFALWLRCLLLVFVWAYGTSIIWQFALLKSQGSIIQIRYQGDGQWILSTNRKRYIATLSRDSVITGSVSILRFRAPESIWRKSCIIFPDTLTKEQYRLLLVTLKLIS